MFHISFDFAVIIYKIPVILYNFLTFFQEINIAYTNFTVRNMSPNQYHLLLIMKLNLLYLLNQMPSHT